LTVIRVGTGDNCQLKVDFNEQKIAKIENGSFHSLVLMENGFCYSGGENCNYNFSFLTFIALKLGRDKSRSGNLFDFLDKIGNEPCRDIAAAGNESFVLTRDNTLYHFTNSDSLNIMATFIIKNIYCSPGLIMMSQDNEIYDVLMHKLRPRTKNQVEVRYVGFVVYVFEKGNT
jgi:hypothetical protein